MASALKRSAFFLLLFLVCPTLCRLFWSLETEGNGERRHRQKREWVVAPRRLMENHDYTGLESIARIRSDKEYDRKILYYLSGPGVDQSPIGRFSIDHNTGYVKIHAILDREEIAMYNLTGIAKFTNGEVAEKDIDIKIYVDDVNDCAPVVKEMQVSFVNESSVSGTFVMQVIATDADEENTIRSKIFYSIDETTNVGGMFVIDPQTGVIRVRHSTLDRETKETYKLKINAADMGGVGGNSGSGEVVVKLLDINDNIPTLEKDTYVGSVEENTANVEVLRIQAVDMDLIHTENWLAVYEIVTGNEGGYFTITTDPKTNEGIITITKELDYEEIKTLNLGVVVRNKAEYNFGSQTTVVGAPKPYPVTINVVNQKEGPRFQPAVKVVTLSEDQTSVSLNKIITTYAAIDSDTLKTATNVRYAKFKDEDNWLIVDEKTADIRLNKLPDRESTFLVNGTYYAKIICISNDTPSKTATGTIAIQVEDFNDHCPLLTAPHTMCLGQNAIFVTAKDDDGYPNAAPFDFTIIEKKTEGKWVVEPHNDTTAILRNQDNLWPGIYKVGLEIKDQQGHSCGPQVVDVTVCTCEETTKVCTSRRTSTSDLGVGAILLLLLGLLLLLLIPLLLLFCLCGGAASVADFKTIPFDTKQQLMTYHTEGIGEDKEVPLLQIPLEVDGATTRDAIHYGGRGQGGFTELGGAGGGGGINMSELTTEQLHHYNQYRQWLVEKEEQQLAQENYFSQYRNTAFDGIALSEKFLGEYYCSKSQQNTEQWAQEDAQVYDYEGRESLAGSVGCCSLLENDNDLSFLNDLGPKFKTLAEICQGSRIETDAFDAKVSIPPVSVRPSAHTHLHTHTETIRDRDRVNVSAVDTTNIATGSSTVVKEQHFTERSQSSATLPKVNVQEKIMIPSQTVLIQQPTMYYAATPMYVVEPQSQMLLVGGAQQQAVGQVAPVGLGQGLVQVAGLQGSQGMVLVDRQVAGKGVVGQAGHGLAHGTKTRKVLVVENGSSGVEHLPAGMIRTTQGATGQGYELRGPSILLSSSGSAEANKDITVMTTPRVQGSQKVVVQHKKVSVTERNIDSSTGA